MNFEPVNQKEQNDKDFFGILHCVVSLDFRLVTCFAQKVFLYNLLHKVCPRENL